MVATMVNPARLLASFARTMEFQNLADSTRYRYESLAREYLASSNGVMSREAVMRYLEELGGSGTYRNWACRPLKKLFTEAKAEWPFTPRELPKPEDPKQPYLTYEQVQNLFKLAKNKPLALALLRTDAVAGARRIQLARMLRTDYDPPNLRVEGAKGGKTRIRRLDPETVAAVNAYLATRKDARPELWASKRGVPMTVYTLSMLFAELAQAAGLPKGTGWHAIRRGVATWLYKAGWREKEIQEHIGWKSPTMPHKYIQLVVSELEEEAVAIHPMFKKSA
ncbi:MAG: tyrosine-type recombinase/integrase [Dehalococcoidia bacterium]|nr:tyrosine-type recombinase/integrase [Dehalococcoidia bacterium]